MWKVQDFRSDCGFSNIGCPTFFQASPLFATVRYCSLLGIILDLGFSSIFSREYQHRQDEEIILFLAALRKYGIYSEWFRYVLTLPMQDANSTLSWQPEEVRALRGTPGHGVARQLRRQLLRLCDLTSQVGCWGLRQLQTD